MNNFYDKTDASIITGSRNDNNDDMIKLELDEKTLDIFRFEVMFVEVKGPTDIVSSKQLSWLHILQENIQRVAICYVKEQKT